jgi:hypothetical protein
MVTIKASSSKDFEELDVTALEKCVRGTIRRIYPIYNDFTVSIRRRRIGGELGGGF